MFRVINLDITFDGEPDIIKECNTIEDAKQCSADNYCFNTSVEQYIDGKWKEILFNGMTKSESEEFSKAVNKAWNALTSN